MAKTKIKIEEKEIEVEEKVEDVIIESAPSFTPKIVIEKLIDKELVSLVKTLSEETIIEECLITVCKFLVIDENASTINIYPAPDRIRRLFIAVAYEKTKDEKFLTQLILTK